MYIFFHIMFAAQMTKVASVKDAITSYHNDMDEWGATPKVMELGSGIILDDNLNHLGTINYDGVFRTIDQELKINPKSFIQKEVDTAKKFYNKHTKTLQKNGVAIKFLV